MKFRDLWLWKTAITLWAEGRNLIVGNIKSLSYFPLWFTERLIKDLCGLKNYIKIYFSYSKIYSGFESFQAVTVSSLLDKEKDFLSIADFVG